VLPDPQFPQAILNVIKIKKLKYLLRKELAGEKVYKKPTNGEGESFSNYSLFNIIVPHSMGKTLVFVLLVAIFAREKYLFFYTSFINGIIYIL
jgi:hypothetical protein